MRRIAESAREREVPALLFVNNRLEGHAPSTIEAVVDSLAPSTHRYHRGHSSTLPVPRRAPPCVNSASVISTFSRASSRHAGGINVLLGDGSIRFLKNSVNAAAWIASNTISNGEVVSSDSY